MGLLAPGLPRLAHAGALPEALLDVFGVMQHAKWDDRLRVGSTQGGGFGQIQAKPHNRSCAGVCREADVLRPQEAVAAALVVGVRAQNGSGRAAEPDHGSAAASGVLPLVLGAAVAEGSSGDAEPVAWSSAGTTAPRRFSTISKTLEDHLSSSSLPFVPDPPHESSLPFVVRLVGLVASALVALALFLTGIILVGICHICGWLLCSGAPALLGLAFCLLVSLMSFLAMMAAVLMIFVVCDIATFMVSLVATGPASVARPQAHNGDRSAISAIAAASAAATAPSDGASFAEALDRSWFGLRRRACRWPELNLQLG